MRKVILFIILFSFALISCKTKKPVTLNTGNLKSSLISLEVNKGYNLKTSKGAVIKIAANSFDVPAGAKVDIEIKEAYSMQDILMAGLTTMSNGKPLQSGGMIYFNASTDGKPVKFLKEIGINVPSKLYNDNMKVFKGEVKADSSINWIEPKPLDTSAALKNLQNGYYLFRANCANCHKILQDYTGPPMAGSRQKAPNAEWAYRFTNNVNSMMQNDPYAKFLIAKYGSRMTQFNLPKEDIKAIFDYCDNEAVLYKPELLLKSSTPMPGTVTADSPISTGSLNIDCGYDTLPVVDATNPINILPAAISNNDTTVFENAVLAEIPMYSFGIDNSGWYNIDCFISNNINDVSDVLLTATINQKEDIIMDVYLCIPSKKLLASGSTDKKNDYFFDEEGGEIKLILNEEAFVFAVGTKKDELYYGIRKFTVKDKQHIIIDIKKSTKEKILEAFRKNKLDSVKIDIYKNEIEKFIEVSNPDSLKVVGDTTILKNEMQIIKKPCYDMYPTIPVAKGK